MIDLRSLALALLARRERAAAVAVRQLAEVVEMPCQKFVITTTGISGTWVRCGARSNSGSDDPEEFMVCVPCKVRKQLEDR